jgi:predicted lysophospholipase L1 biosynthesis ABC-type transport system permease subunit
MKLFTTSLLVLLGVALGLLTVLLLPWLFVTFLSGWLPRPAPAPHVDEAAPPLLAEIERDEWVRGVELWLEMKKGKHE